MWTPRTPRRSVSSTSRSGKLEELVADPDDSFPADWQAQVAAWPQPERDSLFEVVFTSGTTADPKGVMLTHGNILETAGAFERLVELRHHAAVSILPLSHLFEQAPVLFYATAIGAEVATFARATRASSWRPCASCVPRSWS